MLIFKFLNVHYTLLYIFVLKETNVSISITIKLKIITEMIFLVYFPLDTLSCPGKRKNPKRVLKMKQMKFIFCTLYDF